MVHCVASEMCRLAIPIVPRTGPNRAAACASLLSLDRLVKDPAAVRTRATCPRRPLRRAGPAGWGEFGVFPPKPGDAISTRYSASLDHSPVAGTAAPGRLEPPALR